MSRIVLEIAFLFLLPSLVYVSYEAFKRREWPGLGEVLRAAPLANLFMLGAGLMFIGLLTFSTRTGHSPREAYTPSSYSDGKINPGNTGSKPK